MSRALEELLYCAEPVSGADAPQAPVDNRQQTKTGLVYTPLSEVEEKEIDYLWEPYVPLGEMTLLAGDGKMGKSTMAAAIAAAVTTGFSLEKVAGGQPRPRDPRYVIFLSSEDSPTRVLARRFRLLQADSTKIVLPSVWVNGAPGKLTLESLGYFAAMLEQWNPALVVIDPVQSYFGDKDSHRVTEVRPVFDALLDLIEDRPTALLVLAHFNKGGKGVSPRNRIQGSTDFANRARSVLLAGKTQGGERALVHESCNFSSEGPSIEYELSREHALTWLGKCTVTAADLTQVEDPGKKLSKIEQCKGWLSGRLWSGPVSADDVRQHGQEAGFDVRMLHRAADAIGVTKERRGFGGRGEWWWSLSRAVILSSMEDSGI